MAVNRTDNVNIDFTIIACFNGFVIATNCIYRWLVKAVALPLIVGHLHPQAT